MTTRTLTPKPQPAPAKASPMTSTSGSLVVESTAATESTEVVHYRDLADLDHLVESKSGTFWCYCHLAHLPLNEQSSDPRYCNVCYGILMAEYRDMVSVRGKRKPWW